MLSLARKPFIVAEISANHLGSIERALDVVGEAALVGADAVKFQTFTPGQMVDVDVVLKDGPWAGRKALDLYSEAHTPREWHHPLFAYARALSMEAFSSVFHPDDVDFLEGLGCPRYKIASFELTDHNLIRHAARTGKPLIISTGMATLGEIALAANAARAAGCDDLTLLKCTSAYPAQAADANLASMKMLPHVTSCTAYGLSDHTLGIGVPAAAAALGAAMIEKHLTLHRDDGGPDAAFSLEPAEFAEMVKACRDAAAAVGEVRFGPCESEKPMLALRRAPGGKRGYGN